MSKLDQKCALSSVLGLRKNLAADLSCQIFVFRGDRHHFRPVGRGIHRIPLHLQGKVGLNSPNRLSRKSGKTLRVCPHPTPSSLMASPDASKHRRVTEISFCLVAGVDGSDRGITVCDIYWSGRLIGKSCSRLEVNSDSKFRFTRN